MRIMIALVITLGLIRSVTSFSFVGLGLLLMATEENDFPRLQFYGVILICCISAAFLICLILLFWKIIFRKNAGRFFRFKRESFVIGFIYILVGLFGIEAPRLSAPDEFFMIFLKAARFDFLLIGLAAIILTKLFNPKIQN